MIKIDKINDKLPFRFGHCMTKIKTKDYEKIILIGGCDDQKRKSSIIYVFDLGID